MIASDEKVAESYMEEKNWKPKYDVDREKQKEEEDVDASPDGLSRVQKQVFDVLSNVADVPFLEAYKIKIIVSNNYQFPLP